MVFNNLRQTRTGINQWLPLNHIQIHTTIDKSLIVEKKTKEKRTPSGSASGSLSSSSSSLSEGDTAADATPSDVPRACRVASGELVSEAGGEAVAGDAAPERVVRAPLLEWLPRRRCGLCRRALSLSLSGSGGAASCVSAGESSGSGGGVCSAGGANGSILTPGIGADVTGFNAVHTKTSFVFFCFKKKKRSKKISFLLLDFFVCLAIFLSFFNGRSVLVGDGAAPGGGGAMRGACIS